MISKKNKITKKLTDHLGNVRAVVSKDNNGNAAALVSATDYYPGGMPMPGRQFVNGKPYRYGYQGEFAETDEETGKPAFQLRLYDPRINRWLSPDPMRQYHSPYMAMGNNPISRIDPDGGEDIIYLDSDGNEIDRHIMDGAHRYFQETYDGELQAGINVGSFIEIDSPVNINFDAGINQDVVSIQSLNTLRDIGLQSKVWDITITSTARNAKQQAAVMYNNIVTKGMSEQRRTYRSPGQKVLDAYETANTSGVNKNGIIQAMTNRINELGPPNVSNHAADPSVLGTMDLSRSRIPENKRNRFFNNANAMTGVRMLYENAVFHIEIHQN